MQNTYQWEITPTKLPGVIRNCSKCGNSSTYQCSQNFRVNANHRTLDVWLIYQCSKCNNTWNMEILSRTNVNSIDKELYLKFLANDKELAGYYAFDTPTLGRNNATVNYEELDYKLIGDTIPYNELTAACEVTIRCTVPLELRLDKLLANPLVLSREKVKKLCDNGKIISSKHKKAIKLKIKDELKLIIHPSDKP